MPATRNHVSYQYLFPEPAPSHANPAFADGQYSTRKWLWLLAHALTTTGLGIALVIFVRFKVPIAWYLSQLGQQYPAVTNVVITLLATLCTMQLKYTVELAAEHYAAQALHGGITMDQWVWLQALAKTKSYPPLDGRHKRMWVVWVLLVGTMGAHSASLVAIFQPQPFYKNVHFDDSIPCGVDPANLTLSLSPQLRPVQADLDKAAFRIGLQLGSYYDQIDGNATTSVSGRSYVKDNFGYGAVGGLVNGLQELPGVAITAQCGHDTNTSSFLWNSTFPRLDLPFDNITNGTGTFSSPLTSTLVQTVITTPTPFNLSGSQVAMYAVVNASGSGTVLTVDATGDTLVCTWSALPRLVHVMTLNWTAVVTASESAETFPAPVGRAVSSVVQGMAQAVQFGAHLDWDFPLWGPAGPNGPSTGAEDTPTMLQTLIADGLKATLTGYSLYCNTALQMDPERMGVSACNSHNRTLSLHWRFGNVHYLGILAIVHNLALGMFALLVACVVHNKPRVPEVDPFNVVDAFKLGLDKPCEIDPSTRRLLVHDDTIVFRESESGGLIW